MLPICKFRLFIFTNIFLLRGFWVMPVNCSKFKIADSAYTYAGKEPWLLATNLSEEYKAVDIVNL